MVVDLKEFLAKGPRVTIPSQYNSPVLVDVNQELQLTYDLSNQGARIQRAEASHTLVGNLVPCFTFPVVPTSEIHVYHFLGIHLTVGGGASTYKLEIQYPQFAETQDERYQVDTSFLTNMFTASNPGVANSLRGGTPLRVFPEGILVVEKSSSGTAGQVYILSVLREVIGGPAVAEQISSLVVGSEK